MSGGFPASLDVCNGKDCGSSGSAGTTVTTGAANTKGAFAQLIASTTNDACWAVVQLNNQAMAGSACLLDIAVGGSGSEIVIAQELFFPSSGSSAKPMSFPISIPSGTRISARGQSNSATDSLSVSILLFDGSFTQMEGCAGLDALSSNTAASRGASVAAGSSGVKGSYTQLISSTSRDYLGLMLTVGTVSGQSSTSYGLLDISIGGAGSEVAIWPNVMVMIWTSEQYPNGLFIPTAVPSGTRISARLSVATASAVTAAISLHGVYQ